MEGLGLKNFRGRFGVKGFPEELGFKDLVKVCSI